jgi:hypothetical protein
LTYLQAGKRKTKTRRARPVKIGGRKKEEKMDKIEEVKTWEAWSLNPKKSLKGKCLTVIGKKWLDKVNGNTYHSARVYLGNELIACAPFDYGYGDSYQDSAARALIKAGYIKQAFIKDYSKAITRFRFYQKKNIQVLYTCHKDCKQRDVKEWGAGKY